MSVYVVVEAQIDCFSYFRLGLRILSEVNLSGSSHRKSCDRGAEHYFPRCAFSRMTTVFGSVIGDMRCALGFFSVLISDACTSSLVTELAAGPLPSSKMETANFFTLFSVSMFGDGLRYCFLMPENMSTGS